MKIKELDEKEYSKFVNKSGNSFMKSYIWGSVMKNKHFIPHYLGLVDDNNKVVASSMLLEKKLTKKYKFYYSPRGFTIDYNDFSLLKEFSLKLKEYMRINHGIFLKIDPDIKRYDLDNSGNILSSETPLIKYLKELGYVHKGFNLDFSHELPRFTFRLDIDKKYEDIVASYHATTRKIYNKGNEYDLDIFIGDESNIDDFYQVMLETSKREDFVCASYDYYKNFYQTLHKYGMTDLYVVKLDVLKLKEIYNSKINDLTEKINVLKEKNNKKNDNKIKELTNELNKVLKDLEYANSIKETNLVLSSIMTVKYMDTVWTLHGGNSSYFRHLNSNYLIYFNIIKDANLNGYKKIDFYGTSGHANPDKSDPIYGIHNFKKRLGGEYMEFIGEFDLVSNKFLYFLFNMTVPLRRKIINKLLRRKK